MKIRLEKNKYLKDKGFNDTKREEFGKEKELNKDEKEFITRKKRKIKEMKNTELFELKPSRH